MRWGLIGTGPWARSVHAPSLHAHPTAEFVAVWGRDGRKAAELAAEHGARAVDGIDDLFDEVDAVSFAIAPSAQAPLARAAIERGRHVLLEKPVSTDPVVVAELADRVPDDVRAAVFLTRLFEPSRAEWLRGAMDGGYTEAHVEWVSSALTPGSAYADSAWRHGADGAIWDLMPHVLSQVVAVLGDVVEASSEAWTERDGVLVRLVHAGGGITRVRLTLTAQPEERAEWIRFDGPRGSSRSPEGALDFLAAHSAAVSALDDGRTLAEDPLLRWATVRAAVAPTGVMRGLADAWRADIG